MIARLPRAAGPGLQRATTHLSLAMTLKAGLVAQWVGNLTRPHWPQRAEIRWPHAGHVSVQGPGPG